MLINPTHATKHLCTDNFSDLITVIQELNFKPFNFKVGYRNPEAFSFVTLQAQNVGDFSNVTGIYGTFSHISFPSWV